MRERIPAAITVTLLVLLTATAYPQVGASGLAFLKLGVSGRGQAMGDAITANVRGAASTYYNPAGLLAPGPTGSSTQLMVMHKEWIQDTRAEFLGSSIALGDNDAVGFAVNTTTVSDIEIRTQPGEAQGTFTARNLSAGASYARLLSEQLRVGVTGKFLYEKILTDEATGFAFDAGAQYNTPVDGLSVGAVIANLGGMHDLRNEATTLPSTVRLGASYTRESGSLLTSATLAADLVRIFPEHRSYVNTGGEVLLTHNIAVRAGYQFGSDSRGLCAGIGIEYGMITLDYGYAHLSSDLGDTHTISLAMNF